MRSANRGMSSAVDPRRRNYSDGDACGLGVVQEHPQRGRSLSCADGDKGPRRRRVFRRWSDRRRVPLFLTPEYQRRELLGLLGAMAPPTLLKTITADFAKVDAHVLNESGRRIRLAWPKNKVLIVGKRCRTLRCSSRNEDHRVAGYLCCPEPFRFLGSICPDDLEDGEEVCCARRGGWFPEVYLGFTGRLYVYVSHCASDSVSVLARSVDEFVKRGLRCCEFMNMAAVCMPEDVRAVKLGSCRDSTDVMAWRQQFLGHVVALGDGSMIRVCDAYFAGYCDRTIEAWTEASGASCLEIFAVVAQAPDTVGVPPGGRIVLMFDESLTVYAAGRGSGLVIVADGMVELTCRGLSRYTRNVLFHCDGHRRVLSRDPECPNGFSHRPLKEEREGANADGDEDEREKDGDPSRAASGRRRRFRLSRGDSLYRRVLKAVTELQL